MKKDIKTNLQKKNPRKKHEIDEIRNLHSRHGRAQHKFIRILQNNQGHLKVKTQFEVTDILILFAFL